MVRWKVLVLSIIFFAISIFPRFADAGLLPPGIHIENDKDQCVRVAWGVSSKEERSTMLDNGQSDSYQVSEIGREFVRVSAMVERDGEETEETYTLEVTSADKQKFITVSAVMERGSMELR